MNLNKLITRLFLVILTLPAVVMALPDMVPFAEAEKLYDEGSFALANIAYQEIFAESDQLTLEQRRWARLRIADTQWRDQVSGNKRDDTLLEEARKELQELIEEIEQEDPPLPSLWAEAQESLGDSYWNRAYRNRGTASNYYNRAMDWWAGSPNIDYATKRYLEIVWKQARQTHGDYYYPNYVNKDILENAVKIAKTDEENALANYLLAKTLSSQRHIPSNALRAADVFEKALSFGSGQEWYDDALFEYAQWEEHSGIVSFDDDGNLIREPDFIMALSLFQKILDNYKEGESRYYRNAQDRIEQITEPSASVVVPNMYPVDSPIDLSINWRNAENIRVSIYPVDLANDVIYEDVGNANAYDWLQFVQTGDAEPVFVRTLNNTPNREHYEINETLRVDAELGSGAYLVEVVNVGYEGPIRARDILIIGKSQLIAEVANEDGAVYFCDAVTGEPVADAQVTAWAIHRTNNKWDAERFSSSTDSNGIARFKFKPVGGSSNYFFGAKLDNRQAFARLNSWYSAHPDELQWRLYAYTDRPAYRPGETVQWKAVLRTRLADEAYSTPTSEKIRYKIMDARGQAVSEGEGSLTEFGTLFGDLELTDEMSLGLFQVEFRRSNNEWIGRTELFRLEEYKLPEFEVKVELPKETTYSLGDTVKGTIQADYFFGGAVADAEVQLIIRQRPFYHWWTPPREFSWLYDESRYSNPYRHYSSGSEVKRETLRTDPTGKVEFSFETPIGSNNDLEYVIEARVTDSSRREIFKTESVRVTRQPYFCYIEPEHNIYMPGDRAEVTINTMDANSRGVSVEGSVRITREEWREVYLDPKGNEISAEAMREALDKGGWFGRKARPTDFLLMRRGYESEEIGTYTVKTDIEGKGKLEFEVPETGYYKLAWVGRVDNKPPIKAEETIWATDGKVADLGFRPGGVSIIVDMDTVMPGQDTNVLITAPTSGRYVFFSVGAESLMNVQLVHMDGTSKLVRLPIGEEHIPNVWLTAHMPVDRVVHSDQKELIVPPVQQFLEVTLTPDDSQYEPQSEGSYTVEVRDHLGNPVQTELSLGVYDEAVEYIQTDIAGDIRRRFYGDRRQLRLSSSSMNNEKGWMEPEIQISDERGQWNRAAGFSGLVGESRDRFDMVEDSAVSTANYFGAPPAPMAAVVKSGAMREAAFDFEDKDFSKSKLSMDEKAGSELPVALRTDFRSTIYWQPVIVTDENGRGTVDLKYADSLTRWKAVARGVDRGARVGFGDATTQTRLPLIARLQAPRFFTVGDLTTISGVFNNNTDEPLQVSYDLEVEGGLELQTKLEQPIIIEPGKEGRVDWQVLVTDPGEVSIKLTGRGGEYGDAMEKSYTVYPHGIEKFIGHSGKVKGDSVTVKVDLPPRADGSTSLDVQVTPSIAVTMLDSLPYLMNYPYGCTEQTMSRFLPSVMVAKTLKDLGLSEDNIAGKMFGGIEAEHADKTHHNKKRDLSELNAMMEAGLKRLYDFQHSDGGWGWWKRGESDAYMTAYVVWGLTLAEQAGIEVKPDVLKRSREWLDKHLVESELKYDLQAWMLHALASRDDKKPSKSEAEAFINIMENRGELNSFTRALLALSAHYMGFEEDERLLIENLYNGIKRDDTPDASVLTPGSGGANTGLVSTAHWGEDGIVWRWSNGGVEATSFGLLALMTIDPDNDLVEPVLNWLIKNRRGAQWSDTRETAIAVLALTKYLQVSGELEEDLDYTILINGDDVHSESLTLANMLSAPSRISIDPQLLKDGENVIEIKRNSGNGPIYFSVAAEFFSEEEPITAAGSEIFLRRQYYRLSYVPTLLKGFVEERELLREGDSIKSGDRIEVVLTVEGKNNYEYLLFEDIKPSGFESVQLRSGESMYAREVKASALDKPDGSDRLTGHSRWMHQELRDRLTAFFIDKLPEGFWEIRYRLRAETPGDIHGLPVMGHAMYVPEIRANSSEVRVKIVE